MTPARPILRGLATLALSAALLTGCASADPDAGGAGGEAAATRVFAADNGEVVIPVDPQRVVATGYAVPALIEADAALVGISSWGRGVPMMTDADRTTYEGLDNVGGERADLLNYEAVALAEPDLIVVGVPIPGLVDVDMDRLGAIAPVVVLGPTVPSAWRELTRRQADAAGRLGAFEQAKAAYGERAAELQEKYSDALQDKEFGHLGAYGDVAAGTFQREFGDSWGTNIAQDVGVEYYGEVKEKGGGARDVAETPSMELIVESFADADVITYSLAVDGSVPASVQAVLDSPLWQRLPAVQAGNVFPVRYTEAATYASALLTLDSLDETLAPLLPRH